MKDRLKQLLESKTTRRTALKSGLAIVGSALWLPTNSRIAIAQGQKKGEQPLLPPNQVTEWEPRTSEPTDLNEIIRIAAEGMGISEGYVRRIINCESELDPTKINRSGARGLWQIMPVHAPKFTAREWNYWEDWLNPYRNTMVAIDIRHGLNGLANWSCS